MNSPCSEPHDSQPAEESLGNGPSPVTDISQAAKDAIFRICNALCDDTATDKDLAELEAALRGNRAAVRHYIELLGVHTAIDWEVTSRLPQGQSDLASLLDVSIRDVRPTVAPRRRWMDSISGTLLAICAGLLIAFWLSWGKVDWTPSSNAHAEPYRCASIFQQSNDSKWVVLSASGTPAMRTTLEARDTLHLTKGELQMRFGQGAELSLTSPAVLQVLAPDRAMALRGKMTARVNEQAVGFSIDTPRAHVVDLGTRFGLEVDDLGQTDVVVFEGEVDIAYGPVELQGSPWKRRVMKMGEAVHIDDCGDAKRIFSVKSERFNARAAAAASTDQKKQQGAPLISMVHDNIRDNESWNYYEIVHRSMGEDVIAYVDRESHQWNGVDSAGMPAYLVGGDYVKVFNNDKVTEDFQLKLTLDKPCRLYVLFDNRISPPEWLKESFRDTGDIIGLDRGPYRRMISKELIEDFKPGVGPGVSVEDTSTVWERIITKPTTVSLGATEASTLNTNMYGIVAVPLDGNSS